jgi:hypothetical protein
MSAARNVLIAAIVIAVGAALAATGQLRLRLAEARRAFLMMQHEVPVDEYQALERTTRLLPGVSGIDRWRTGLHTRQDEAHYWSHQYGRLSAGSDRGSVAARLLRANATYHQRLSENDTAPDTFERIARLYLDVLDADAGLVDAAYNYELMIRRRDAAAKDRSARRRPRPADGGETPSLPTVHGEAGAVPANADTGDFKVIVPQQPDERRQQPDAGAGGGKVRKG